MLKIRFLLWFILSLTFFVSVSCKDREGFQSSQKYIDALDADRSVQLANVDDLENALKEKALDAKLPKFLTEVLLKSNEDEKAKLESDIETLYGIFSNAIQSQENGQELVDNFTKQSQEEIKASNEKLENEFQEILKRQNLHESKVSIYKETLLAQRLKEEAKIQEIYTTESARDVLGFHKTQTNLLEGLIEQHADVLEFDEFEATMNAQLSVLTRGYVDFIFDTSPKIAK